MEQDFCPQQNIPPLLTIVNKECIPCLPGKKCTPANFFILWVVLDLGAFGAIALRATLLTRHFADAIILSRLSLKGSHPWRQE